MAKPRIRTSFGNYNDANLEHKAATILSSMDGNDYFIDPKPPLIELETAIHAFHLAIVKANETASGVNIRDRERRRIELILLLDKLAYYVQLEAVNDVALASSGFSIPKIPQPVGQLPKPKNFIVAAKDKGVIHLRFKAIRGARIYQYEYRRIGAAIWQVIVHTKSAFQITELESGGAYEFRVTGVGTHPLRTYSDVLSSYVL